MAVAEATMGEVDLVRKPRSPWADAFRQLLKNRVSVASGIFILLLVIAAITADWINPYVLTGYGDELERVSQPAYAKQVLRANNAPPGAVVESGRFKGFVYILGADNLGRDLLSRTLYGARVSIAVAVVAASVSLVVGLIYGIVSGYLGGRVDEIMMRLVDLLYGLPVLIVVILMQVFFKALARRGEATGFVGVLLDINKSFGGLLFVFIAMGLLNWIGMARLARGQVLSYKEKEFVEAARSIGAGPLRLIFVHLLPNVIGPCIVQETLQIPGYILTEAFLSFIGLGVDAPTPSWGIMIQEGYQALRSYPHILFPPSAALCLTVLAFNFLGDGLRDALDPTMRGT